jgi:alpha-tubulin suppressor-like RCC1 family protein
MSAHPFKRIAMLGLATAFGLVLLACGGSDGTPPAPPAPTGTVIGPAGGTVTGPNGAQVVIPAGALTSDTTITIAQSASGAPAMPAGFAAFGLAFAFTPHGTTFAAPVTITVPFDPAALPAGRTPVLYKTNAQGQWERVDNGIVSAATVSAQVTSFSWVIIGNIPPAITQQPQDLSVVEGAGAAFSVAAFGTPPLTFQWQQSNDGGVTFADIAGQTSSSYSIGATSIAAHHDRRYRVIIGSPEGSTTSNAARLTVTVTAAPPAALAGRLAAGKQHSLAVPANGTLQSWGVVSDFLEIGRGAPGNVPGPLNFFTGVTGPGPLTRKVRSVAAGQWHSIVVMDNGTVFSFGYGLFGQLGTGQIGGGPQPPAVQVRYATASVPQPGVVDAVDACAGQYHSVLRRATNHVEGFGSNDFGQLSDGTTLNRFGPVPARFADSSAFFARTIGCGWNHTLAVHTSGTTYAWGSNSSGQLGATGVGASSLVPVPVVTSASGPPLADVIAVAGGEHHSLALKSDGTVWAWGSNANGKLGDGTDTDRAFPVQVLTAASTPLTGIVAISAGGEFSLALHSDGTVYSWGINEVGQLGNGGTSPGMRNVAAQVINLTGVVAIVAGRNGGDDHALALDSDGRVWAWGYNNEGQLGIGSPNFVVSTPTQVPGLNLN